MAGPAPAARRKAHLTCPDVARSLVLLLALWSFPPMIAVASPAPVQSDADRRGPVVEIAAASTDSAEASEMGGARLRAADAYRLALLEMKAHLNVARTLVWMRASGAEHFMKDRVREIFRRTEDEIEDRNASFTADFLQELENVPADDPLRALTTIESAVLALNGSFAQTGAMDAQSVLAISEALLREAVARYAEAVSENEVIDLRKYQSGRGFAYEAEALVRYSGAIKGNPGHQDLVEAITLIRQAWPGVDPPPIVSDPSRVAGRLDEAVAVMDKMR